MIYGIILNCREKQQNKKNNMKIKQNKTCYALLRVNTYHPIASQRKELARALLIIAGILLCCLTSTSDLVSGVGGEFLIGIGLFSFYQ